MPRSIDSIITELFLPLEGIRWLYSCFSSINPTKRPYASPPPQSLYLLINQDCECASATIQIQFKGPIISPFDNECWTMANIGVCESAREIEKRRIFDLNNTDTHTECYRGLIAIQLSLTMGLLGWHKYWRIRAWNRHSSILRIRALGISGVFQLK